MRSKTIFYLTILLACVLTSCSLNAENTEHASEATLYTGPIIDMHLHAYAKPSPLFGQQMPPNPLTGKSYTSSASLEAHKEECFDIFKKHVMPAMEKARETAAEAMQQAATDLGLPVPPGGLGGLVG